MIGMLRIGLLVLIFLVEFSSPLGPSLEDLTHKECPTLRPVLCLPYGLCCRYSEFCYAGLCESCFFEEVRGTLLDWCRNYGQHNVSLMRSQSCRLACQDEFTSQQLANVTEIETIIYKEKDEPIGQLQDSPEKKDNYFGILVAVLVLVVLIVFMLIFMTKIWKPLLELLKPKFLRLRKSDKKINTDIVHVESPQDGSPSRNGQPSNTDGQNISKSNQPTRSSIEQGLDDIKEDDTLPESNKKPTKSEPAPNSFPILGAASERSEAKAEVKNRSKIDCRNGDYPKKNFVHHHTIKLQNGLTKNNLTFSASCKPKNENCICQDNNEIDDEDSNSHSTPLLACVDIEKENRVCLPDSTSYKKRQSYVLDSDDSDPLSSTASSLQIPEDALLTQEGDMIHVNILDEFKSNSPLQADGRDGQKNYEELGATVCGQVKELALSVSSSEDLYANQTVTLDDKPGAKASITNNQSI